MNRRIVALSAAALVAATSLLSGCGSDDSGNGDSTGSSKIRVVASTDVYGDIASKVGGEQVEVTSILTNPEQDPHSFEADPRTTLAVSKADVIIENGGGYDDYMQKLRDANAADAPVIDVVKLSGKTAPAGGALNEHVWYDLPTVQKFADELAKTLGTADPDHATDFTTRAQSFDDEVGKLIARETAVRAQTEGKAIGITEPVPLYMTTALGLKNDTPPAFSEAVEEGEDVSPRVLNDTLDLYRDKKVSALIYNSQTSGPVTEKVKSAAEDAGIAVVPVTETLPNGKDYLSWMSDNIEAMATALGAS